MTGRRAQLGDLALAPSSDWPRYDSTGEFDAIPPPSFRLDRHREAVGERYFVSLRYDQPAAVDASVTWFHAGLLQRLTQPTWLRVVAEPPAPRTGGLIDGLVAHIQRGDQSQGAEPAARMAAQLAEIRSDLDRPLLAIESRLRVLRPRLPVPATPSTSPEWVATSLRQLDELEGVDPMLRASARSLVLALGHPSVAHGRVAAADVEAAPGARVRLDLGGLDRPVRIVLDVPRVAWPAVAARRIAVAPDGAVQPQSFYLAEALLTDLDQYTDRE